MKKIIITIVIIGLVNILTGCAQNVSPNIYSGSEVGIVSKVKRGVIVSRRAVTIDNNSSTGGVAGVAAGAAGGSTLGNGTSSNVVGAVGGAVIGGLIGSAIDKSVNTHKGFEYIIKLNNGPVISVVQTAESQFKPKQHVLIIYGAMTRLAPDNELG